MPGLHLFRHADAYYSASIWSSGDRWFITFTGAQGAAGRTSLRKDRYDERAAIDRALAWFREKGCPDG